MLADRALGAECTRIEPIAQPRIDLSAHGSDSEVVNDWSVVPPERVPSHVVKEQPSPLIEGWFGPQATVLLVLNAPRSNRLLSLESNFSSRL